MIHGGTIRQNAMTSRIVLLKSSPVPSSGVIFPKTVKPSTMSTRPTTVKRRAIGHASGLPRDALTVTRTTAG